ncbi:GNAT family N-acetyltransferase [Chryseobacterium sp.]|uniref:GNAT family N-acetyltransferase n=1 Tax=Chryseobacterium sp. TaxID=1871047 RepID=UPI0011CACB20|nr:GNAT family N-acetyltransferase [Chryseobacterium sp.]TXF76060.1 GNAT family N-acetyltransferase [Chryseobacterium sp.]
MIPQTFETERLSLRPMSAEDSAFILELYNQPNFLKYIGDKNIRTVEEAEEYIKTRFRPQIEKLGYGNYLITRKEDKLKIGSVGIFEREGMEIHDIGFSFLGEFEGKGYGFEAASELMKQAFAHFGLKKVSAVTSKDNFASQKLIEKLGLRFQKLVFLPNDPEELMYYETENV